MFNQEEFFKLKGRKFFHFQAAFENLADICVTYRFKIFALPVLHIACCVSQEIAKVSKPICKGGFTKNEKQLKEAWTKKALELKNKNQIKYPSVLKVIELLFPLQGDKGLIQPEERMFTKIISDVC